MDEEDVERVLRLYGSEIKKRSYGKIIATCPFAPWKHSGGSDKNPSFAALNKGRGRWSYNCFSCGEKGHAKALFWRMGKLHGRGNLEANRILYADDLEEREDNARFEYRIGGSSMGDAHVVEPDWDEIRTSGGSQDELYASRPRPKPVDRPPDAEWIARCCAAPVPAYASLRGLDHVHASWELGHDEPNRRWIHPVRAPDGDVVGYTGRLYWQQKHCFRCGTQLKGEKTCPKCHQSYVKYKHHPGQWRRTSLFGAHMVEPGTPVVLVEGTTDALRLWSYGVRSPCAMLGTNPNMGQMQLVASLTDRVLIMGDGDEAGRAMNGNVTRALRSHVDVTTETLELPEGLDPGDMTEQQARELLPENYFR